jgi:hypothetical protein
MRGILLGMRGLVRSYVTFAIANTLVYCLTHTSKRRFTLNGLHGVIAIKTELFTETCSLLNK